MNTLGVHTLVILFLIFMLSSCLTTDAKRLIGRRFTDQAVQRDIRLWPFKVISSHSREDKPSIVVTRKGIEKQYAPEQISSMILLKMKETAETYLNSIVEDVVITVPAYFNNSQRQATKDAAALAGLNVMRVINEPTAAAIAYNIQRKVVDQNNEVRNVLVFDLGGGTFDVSVVVVGKGLYEVKAISGDTHLGGSDFDNNMVSYFVDMFWRKYGKDITHNYRALSRLRYACEKAKRTLTITMETFIEVDCLHEGLDFSTTVTRARFELLNMNLFRRCIDLVEKCLMDANMEKSQINDILLVGGSTRIPKVQQMLKEFFNGKELCKSLNPDEAVASGAGMLAAVLSGMQRSDQQPVVVLDVIPLSIGTELKNGQFDVVIPRNTRFPVQMEKYYTTADHYQTQMETLVYEGESPIAEHNTYLDGFFLNNIPPAPKGVPVIIDNYSIDEDGILTVTSTEASTGRTNQIVIDNHSGRLTEEEIGRMLMEAMEYKMEESQSKIVTRARTELENFVNNMWAIVSGEGSERMDYRSKKVMADAIQRTIDWLDWNPYLNFEYHYKYSKKMVKLKNICDPIIAEMHHQQNANDVEILKKPKIEPFF